MSIFIKKLKNLIRLCNIYIYPFIYILCIVTVALTMSLERTVTMDYHPINGDWQNYNPMRRVLDGQIPFVDFVPYLGLGAIALNIIPLAFNNTFGMSLFITTFTTTVCFFLFSLTIFYLTTKKLRIAMLLSAFSLLLLRTFSSLLLRLNNIKVISVVNYFLIDLLNDYLRIGLSSRMLRSFLPIMLALLLLLVMRLKHRDIFDLLGNKKNTAIIGAICGFFILWSNDFGFCAVGSAGLSLFLCLLYTGSKFKDIIISLLIFTASVLTGLLIAVVLFTLGHPLAYLNTASGIAKYQYWYFWLYKISRISELIYIILPLYIPVPIVYFVIFYKFKKKKISDKDILLFFVITTVLTNVLLYGFGAGRMKSSLLFYTAITAILGWIIKPLLHLFKNILKPTSNILLAILLFMNIFPCIKAMNNKAEITSIPYVSELGGHTNFGRSLYSAKEFLGNEKIFSTYASALENITDQFQPTGTDYIIHVLGDKQREDYLNNFLKGNYRFAQTIRADYDAMEKWIERANWFFYRELINRYKPVMLTDYSVIWESCDSPRRLPLNNNNIEIAINNAYDYCELLIDIKYNIDCIADVEIEYLSFYNNIFKYRINTFRKYVLAYDYYMQYEPPVDIIPDETGPYWGIPDDKTSYYVPVVIKNGKGQLVLHSNPGESTIILLYGAKVIKLLPLNDPY